MIAVRKIDYQTAKEFAHGCELKVLNLDKKNAYYGLYVNNSLISIASFLKIGKNEIRLKSNYTKQEHRHHGHMTMLLEHIMKENNAKLYSAYCEKESLNLYLNLGFKIVKFRQNPTFCCWVVNKENKDYGSK